MPRTTKMIFSKSLTQTDTKKRLAIPSKILHELLEFNGSHAVKIPIMYGTRLWQIVCSVRKEGYKKPVLSRGWREFVRCNDFRVGDILTLYKVQEDDGSFHYRVEVQKPATRPSGDLFHPVLSGNHEVDETIGAGSGKFNNLLKHEKKPVLKANDAPVKEEGAIIEPANAVAIVSFVEHGSAKSPNTIFPTSRSDEAASKAQFKNEQEPGIKIFGTMVSINTGMGEPFRPYYMTKPFDLNGEDGSLVNDGTSHAAAKACYKIAEGFSLDLVHEVQPLSTFYEEVNLDLTLAQPIVEIGI